MQEQFWYIRNCSLFHQLSADQLGNLERHARIREFPRNGAIYLPSDAADGACLLAAGRVRICSTTPQGKQVILALVEPGELFGELALIQGGARDERAEAVTDSTVVLLPADELRHLMETSANLSLGITKRIGQKLKRVERRLLSLLFHSNRDRLAHLLIELVEQYGRTIPEGVLIDIKLSHQELASIIGATRETVTSLLGEMQLEGLLLVSRQKLIVRDLGRLAADQSVPLPKVTVSSASANQSREYRMRSQQMSDLAES